jgi:hypothetical protein
METIFPKGDLFRVTGESIAADTAFIVGAATNNPQLQATAVAGMQETTAGQAGSLAVVGLITLGKGEEVEVGPEFSSTPGMKAGSSGGPGAGKTFNPSVKDAAEVQAGGNCVFCGQKTTREPGPSQRNTDHADPKALGGNNTLKNAQNTCRSCNQDKRMTTTQQYLEKRNEQQ